MNLSMERLQASLPSCFSATRLCAAGQLPYLQVRLHWLDIVTLLFILSGVYVLTAAGVSSVQGIILAGIEAAGYILYSGRVSKGDR